MNIIKIEIVCPVCGKKQFVTVKSEELITRLTGRRVCKSCGASFHVVNIPPKKEGVCDYCGGELIQRAFPYLTSNERETLITGICDNCFLS